MSITEATRRDILDYLIAGNISYTGSLDLLEFLSRTWDLNAMPSTDGRYQTAYGDIWKHCVMNEDWTLHYLLCTYLELPICEDAIFFKFLENCIHPVVRPDAEQQRTLVQIFNNILARDNYGLRETSQIAGKLVFKVVPVKAGVPGSVKNLIFAANGDKPELVLIDAVNNDIKIVENEQYCLVYDKPILDRGLLWTDLLDWWQEQQPQPFSDRSVLQRSLWQRLQASLSKDSPPERLLFQTYYGHFRRKLGDNLPALIPQVYLHYDPKTIRQLVQDDKDLRLVRQRMDFLLLFSNHTRIVLEVDGQQHYSINGKAEPERYAQMVAEDRRIRLQGYEIYRFGGAELHDEQRGRAAIIDFFNALFQQHAVKK